MYLKHNKFLMIWPSLFSSVWPKRHLPSKGRVLDNGLSKKGRKTRKHRNLEKQKLALVWVGNWYSHLSEDVQIVHRDDILPRLASSQRRQNGASHLWIGVSE